MNDIFLNKLEALKQKGCYSINIFFGEDIGCDDSDISLLERNCRVICSPVGHLGSTRVMINGNVQQFIDLDLDTKPIIISNPPKREEYKEPGMYAWGAQLSEEDDIFPNFTKES